MPVQWSIRRLRNVWRWLRLEGALYTTFYILDRITPGFIFNIGRGLIVRCDMHSLPEIVDSGKLHFRWGSPEDIEALANLGIERHELRKWFDRGFEFLIAEEADRMLGFECYQRADPEFTNKHMVYLYAEQPWFQSPLPAKHVWARFAYVDPAFRGRGVVSELLKVACDRYVRLGHEYMFGCIGAANPTAQRAHEKRGFIPVGTFFAVRVLGFALVRGPKLIRLGWWSVRCPLVLAVDDFCRHYRRPRRIASSGTTI